MNINTEINRLLNFAKQRGLISEDDYYYSANLLIDVLHVGEFVPEDIEENLETAAPILANLLDFAVQEKLIEDTVSERDLFDTRLMNCVMPRPSEVVRRFQSDYARAPKAATANSFKIAFIFSPQCIDTIKVLTKNA